MNYTFHWYQAFRALPEMLWGALVTIEVAVLSMVIGIAFGVAAGARPQLEEQAALRLVDGLGRGRAQHAGAVPDLHGVFRPGLARHLRRFLPGAADRHLVQQRGLSRRDVPRRPARHSADADARGALARHERAAGVPPDRAAAAVPHGLPSDDEPDGLGHPDDLAGRDRRRQHRPGRRHAGAQRAHVPHVRVLRAWRRRSTT